MTLLQCEPVTSFSINQATSSLFRDLYIQQTMLVLVQAGSKLVSRKGNLPFEVRPGELLIFPSGSFLTFENRIVSGSDYQALCISYPDSLTTDIFKATPKPHQQSSIHLKKCPAELVEVLGGIKQIAQEKRLPASIVRHRLLEPLIWLKTLGVTFEIPVEKPLDCLLRDKIAADPTRRWRANHLARELGYSEATLRRRLRECGTNFSSILTDVRLELGLTQLQSTHVPISQIALDCGFATPSHFSDSFKDRFGIAPKLIRKRMY